MLRLMSRVKALSHICADALSLYSVCVVPVPCVRCPCIYVQLWDSFGRCLVQGVVGEHVATSVAFSPDGELVAVGSFNTMLLCDRNGVRVLIVRERVCL